MLLIPLFKVARATAEVKRRVQENEQFMGKKGKKGEEEEKEEEEEEEEEEDKVCPFFLFNCSFFLSSSLPSC